MEKEKRKHRWIAKWALLAAAMGALALVLGLAARPMLDDETAQAHVLVEQGERALALGDRGAAVLALERARWLAPRAGFVRAAIAHAEIHDAEPLAPRTLRLVTSREWSAIAVVLGWTSGVALALAVARRRSRTAGKIAVAAVASFAAAMVALVAASDTSPAVVTSPGERVRVAPYADAAASGPLPAGTMVVRGPEHGGFVRVRSGDGVGGWMPRTSVEPIGRLEG